jgi:hypothetical protein
MVVIHIPLIGFHELIDGFRQDTHLAPLLVNKCAPLDFGGSKASAAHQFI